MDSVEHVATHLAAALAMAATGDLFGLEWVLLLATWLAARKCRRFGEGWFARLEAMGTRFAERKVAAPVALAFSVILVRAAMLPVHPIPHPVVADEFSHLLLADTLAHGRLANPPHAHWRSFESLHVIPQPTYSSMYFPGPALLLWLGQVTTGEPWWGLLTGMGALCGLVCWALQAWFPARWALLGGILTALHIGLLSYWVDSYWGGTFAALGSALVFGSLARLMKQRKAGWPATGLSLAMAVGVGMLANSRPYEGLVLCVPVAGWLAWWLFKGRGLAARLIRCALPMAVMLVLIGAGMGLYLKAVTGNPLKLPYAVNQERYGWPLTLKWTKAVTVEHDRPEFAAYYQYEVEQRGHFDSVAQFVGSLVSRLQADWRLFVGPALTIPCLFLPVVWRKRRLRFPMVAGAVAIAGVCAIPHFPHYMSPAFIPITAVWVESYRHLRQGHGERRQLGLRLSRAIPLILLAMVGLRVAAGPLHLMALTFGGYTSWCCSNPGTIHQSWVERQLPPGRHLLLVRYQADHKWMNDWVHNQADIDGARVAWARELGGEADAKLIRYFKDRRVWLVEPDIVPPRLTPYSEPHHLRSHRDDQGDQ